MPGMVQASIVGATPAVGAKCPTGAREHGDPGAVRLRSSGRRPQSGRNVRWRRGRTAMPGAVRAAIVGSAPAVGAKCPMAARESGDAGRGPGCDRRVGARSRGDMPDGGEGERRCWARSGLRSSGRRPQSGRNARWRRGRTAMPGAVRAAIVGSAPAVGAKCPMAARENGGAGEMELRSSGSKSRSHWPRPVFGMAVPFLAAHRRLDGLRLAYRESQRVDGDREQTEHRTGNRNVNRRLTHHPLTVSWGGPWDRGNPRLANPRRRRVPGSHGPSRKGQD